MYKVTVGGKTMVGNNEDSWGQDSRIWFEPGVDGKFGVVNVGYARKQPNPDGAMNEYGLVFDGFTMAHKPNMPERHTNKSDFSYDHIKVIMQRCKTVDEVHTYLEKMNLHVLNGSILFNGGMLLFVDKSGKYLVVEATKMSLGDDDNFLLANFSYADTKDLSTIKMERYRKGVNFINNKPLDTSVNFCKALSDTMSVSRAKACDGTLYTSVYNLDKGLIHLYFFHDYTQSITLNLKEELAKGEHTYSFTELFPNNKNYQRFIDYKTPTNSKAIIVFLIASGLLFAFSTLCFLRSFLMSKMGNYKYLKLLLSLLSASFTVYLYVLLRNDSIYYFPAPYTSGQPALIATTAYLPLVLLLVIIPLVVLMVIVLKHKQWHGFTRFLFALNNLAYFVLLTLFAYWQLFIVF